MPDDRRMKCPEALHAGSAATSGSSSRAGSEENFAFLNDLMEGNDVRKPLPIDAELPLRLGRFELRRRLGGGGFGAVYLALNLETHSEYAVKLLGSSLNADAERIELDGLRGVFARVGQHENVLPCYPPDRDDTHGLFYAMPLADPLMAYGARYDPSTLAGDIRSRQGPRDYSSFLRLALALCAGASYMHSRRVAHCDIKPGNVVRHQGTWRLADFGLATPLELGRPRGSTNRYAPSPDSPGARSLVSNDLACIGATLFEAVLSDEEWNRVRDGALPETSQVFRTLLDESINGRREWTPFQSEDENWAAARLVRRLRGDGDEPFTSGDEACNAIRSELAATKTSEPNGSLILKIIREYRAAAIVLLAVVVVTAGVLYPLLPPSVVPNLPPEYTIKLTLTTPKAHPRPDYVLSHEVPTQQPPYWSNFRCSENDQLTSAFTATNSLHLLVIAVGPDDLEQLWPNQQTTAQSMLQAGTQVEVPPDKRAYLLAPPGWHAVVFLVSRDPIRPLSEWRHLLGADFTPGVSFDNPDVVYLYDGRQPWPLSDGYRATVVSAMAAHPFSIFCEKVRSLSTAKDGEGDTTIDVRAIALNVPSRNADNAAVWSVPSESRPEAIPPELSDQPPH